MRFSFAVCLFSLSSVVLPAGAQKKDSFVFPSDGGGQVYSFDSYRRLAFSADSFVLSPVDGSLEPVILLYDEYRKVVFGGSASSGIREDITHSKQRLYYDAMSRKVAMSGPHAPNVRIGIFSADGKLVAMGLGAVNIARLASGVYIAVAVGPDGKYSIKFNK